MNAGLRPADLTTTAARLADLCPSRSHARPVVLVNMHRERGAGNASLLGSMTGIGAGIVQAIAELAREPNAAKAESLAVVLGAAQRRAAQLAHGYAQQRVPVAAGDA